MLVSVKAEPRGWKVEKYSPLLIKSSTIGACGHLSAEVGGHAASTSRKISVAVSVTSINHWDNIIPLQRGTFNRREGPLGVRLGRGPCQRWQSARRAWIFRNRSPDCRREIGSGCLTVTFRTTRADCCRDSWWNWVTVWLFISVSIFHQRGTEKLPREAVRVCLCMGAPMRLSTQPKPFSLVSWNTPKPFHA